MEIDFLSRKCVCLANPRMASHELKPDVEISAHVWVATSGTTGSIKWAALSYEAILHSAEAVNKHFQVSAKDIWINPLPLFHVGGIGISARSFLGKNAVHPLNEWNPEAFMALANDTGATLSALVPAQLHDLLKLDVSAPKRLRALIIGGGALSNEMFEKAIRLKWPVAPSYGMTECCSQVATALPGENNMRILPHVGLQDSPLRIKSRSLLTAYWQEGRKWDPKKDGWFTTEDLVAIEPPFVRFLGREGDVIKILGENVNLARLQQLLDKILSAHHAEGCLVAEPDPRSSYRIALYTTCLPSLKDKILEEFHSLVMPYERIQEVKHLDSLPKTALGKVEKHKLASSDALV